MSFITGAKKLDIAAKVIDTKASDGRVTRILELIKDDKVVATHKWALGYDGPRAFEVYSAPGHQFDYQLTYTYAGERHGRLADFNR